MHIPGEYERLLARRHFFGRSATGIGAVALAPLLRPLPFGRSAEHLPGVPATALPRLHLPPRAKRVIFLFMSGGPSQIDLFDHKPSLQSLHGQELPESVRRGQRVTGMTADQTSFACIPSLFRYSQQGQAGTWISELLPHTAKIVDDIAVVNSLNTEAINHDPAFTFIQTGAQQPGRPALGAWLSYGIGSEAKDLPTFIVMVSQGSGNKNDQPIVSRLWGSGFLPTEHQGVRFRGGKDPVHYLSNPPGVDRSMRRNMLDAVGQLNRLAEESFGDPEINTRIAQYEMAFRMQTSVPALTDFSDEPQHVLDMHGIDNAADGGFARNCLLARRMAERGVRFVQLIHRGWDQHSSLESGLTGQSKDVDRPSAALVTDLKMRGLLDDTLIIWGGEFGRSVYSQGKPIRASLGRDHHGRCFSIWLAGGGIRGGITYGKTDDYSYNVVQDPVHIHDLNATILHCLGLDHARLTYRYQGRDFRLTDVGGNVVRGLLS
jgi:hypothetical protein